MIIVKQEAKLLHMTHNALELIERAGRTCYKSEERITTDSNVKFVEMLITRGHESVLEHATATFHCVTDRGVSHELVRHRIASYSQESTRYCNYKGGISVIEPPGLSKIEYDVWESTVRQCECAYNVLLSKGPQIARSVLPQCLKTEIVITANFREWRTIFKQRLAPAAHPQMRELMLLIYDIMVRSSAAACFQFRKEIDYANQVPKASA